MGGQKVNALIATNQLRNSDIKEKIMDKNLLCMAQVLGRVVSVVGGNQCIPY